ncbi:MAG: hypothetical protein IVW36_05855 [Dehalococcoidia bacterium]|nr:hypothetical protein [Dehalococcoidia bacterium]
MTGRLSRFDTKQLLPGERLLREARAELLLHFEPYRWDGALVLTSERLFFLPQVTNPLIAGAAFWIDEVARVARTGRHRLHVTADSGSASFALVGSMLAPRDRAQPWLREIAALASLRPAPARFDAGRRRAG